MSKDTNTQYQRLLVHTNLLLILFGTVKKTTNVGRDWGCCFCWLGWLNEEGFSCVKGSRCRQRGSLYIRGWGLHPRELITKGPQTSKSCIFPFLAFDFFSRVSFLMPPPPPTPVLLERRVAGWLAGERDHRTEENWNECPGGTGRLPTLHDAGSGFAP